MDESLPWRARSGRFEVETELTFGLDRDLCCFVDYGQRGKDGANDGRGSEDSEEHGERPRRGSEFALERTGI